MGQSVNIQSLRLTSIPSRSGKNNRRSPDGIFPGFSGIEMHAGEIFNVNAFPLEPLWSICHNSSLTQRKTTECFFYRLFSINRKIFTDYVS